MRVICGVLVGSLCAVLVACGEDDVSTSTPDGGGAGGKGGSGGSAATGGGGGTAGSGGNAGAGGTAGSGGTGGTAGVAGAAGAGAQSQCEQACAKTATANCPQDPPLAECTSECLNDFGAVVSQCGAQSTAFLDCLINTSTLSCVGGYTEVDGCDTEYQAYHACAGCLSTPGDDACETCIKADCCAEEKAFFGDADAFKFLDCTSACGNQTPCIQQCEGQFPAAAQKFNALNTCADTKCVGKC